MTTPCKGGGVPAGSGAEFQNPLRRLGQKMHDRLMHLLKRKSLIALKQILSLLRISGVAGWIVHKTARPLTVSRFHLYMDVFTPIYLTL